MGCLAWIVLVAALTFAARAIGGFSDGVAFGVALGVMVVAIFVFALVADDGIPWTRSRPPT